MNGGQRSGHIESSGSGLRYVFCVFVGFACILRVFCVYLGLQKVGHLKKSWRKSKQNCSLTHFFVTVYFACIYMFGRAF